jgi:hypothetical protein
MKAFFNKLVSSIPLRPQVAILLSFLFGYVGNLLPWGHLAVTMTDVTGTSNISPSVFWGVGDTFDLAYCRVPAVDWQISSNWFQQGDWKIIIMFLLPVLWVQYLQKFSPKTPKALGIFFVACSIFLLTPIFLMVRLTPNSIWDCPEGLHAVVHGFSISWFTILLVGVSPLLVIYAYIKQLVDKKNVQSNAGLGAQVIPTR